MSLEGADSRERTLRIPDRLWDTLEVMAREMAVPVESLVSQALFSWARINGYLEPTPIATEPPILEARLATPEAGQPGILSSPGLLDAPVPSVPLEAAMTAAELGDPAEEGPLESTVIRAVPTELTSRKVFVVYDGQEYEVTSERFIIGRDVLADLVIDSQRLSRHHAAVLVSGLLVEIEDMRSSNGTWFNGHPVTRRVVQSGEVYHLAEIPVRIEMRAGVPSRPALKGISLDGLG